TLTKVKALFAREGITLETKNLKEALVIISDKIKDGSETPTLAKSEKLAVFGDKLLEIVKNDFTKAEFMMISYYVGESVLKMERIPLKKYKTVEAPDILSTNGVLNIKDFHKMVESYIDNTAAYRDLPSDVGFIDWTDIRHLYSNNSWGIGLRHHDMYHLHYAYGHPYYVAVNFQASRGINDRRYAMISSFWESVDTNQTTFESKISKFFGDKGMSPQEGMIYLARATKEMMKEIDKAEANSYYNETSQEVVNDNNIGLRNGWQPFAVANGRGAAPTDLAVYDKEIEDFINKSFTKLANPANKKYYNFHRLGPGKKSTTDEDITH
ncbi:MAG: hypothetical protein ABL930_08685, partial [Pseudobdellovibrio sp.]